MVATAVAVAVVVAEDEATLAADEELAEPLAVATS